jgi:hypothetical protein
VLISKLTELNDFLSLQQKLMQFNAVNVKTSLSVGPVTSLSSISGGLDVLVNNNY